MNLDRFCQEISKMSSVRLGNIFFLDSSICYQLPLKEIFVLGKKRPIKCMFHVLLYMVSFANAVFCDAEV